MKKAFLIAWALVAGIASFAQEQEKVIQIESSQASDEDFSKFKTFAFSSIIDGDLEAGVHSTDDLVLKSQLRQAIQDELMGRGYTVDKNDSDLIVNFQIFEKPTTITGFQANASSDLQITDQTSYDVKAGTLVISLLDRKDAKVVWQGFASGIIDNDMVVTDKASIRQAVNLTLANYSARADNY